MSGKRKSMLPGLIIIAIGVLLLIHNFRVLRFSWDVHFPLILAIIGLIFWLNALFRKEKGGVFLGTIFLIIGGFYYFRNIDWIPYYYVDESWPIFPFAFGIAFFASFIFNPKEWGVLVPGVILTLIGIYFGLQEMFYVDTYRIEAIFSYWPVILIIIGAGILFKNLVKSSEEKQNTGIEGPVE